MPKAVNGSVKIHWDLRGQGEPLLLIMGLAMSSGGWYRLLPHLEGRYQAITFDNRGTGGSDRPWRPFTMGDMVGDALAVLDAAGIEQAHVLGASLGGMVAQNLALSHPERVKSLLLGCTTASIDSARRSVRTSMGVILRPLIGIKRSFPIIAPALYSKRTLTYGVDRLAEDLRQRISDATPIRTNYAQLGVVARHDTQRRLPQLKMPTLVLHGEEDGMLPVECGRHLAMRIPNAELVTLPDCAHMMTTDEEAGAANAILGFLDRQSGDIMAKEGSGTFERVTA